MAAINIPSEVKPVIGATANNKTYQLFQSANEVVPLASGDTASISSLSKQLGASLGTATVAGGVLHISLAKAAEGRCSLRSLK